jgi:hypothetical protein
MKATERDALNAKLREMQESVNALVRSRKIMTEAIANCDAAIMDWNNKINFITLKLEMNGDKY